METANPVFLVQFHSVYVSKNFCQNLSIYDIYLFRKQSKQNKLIDRYEGRDIIYCLKTVGNTFPKRTKQTRTSQNHVS